METELKETIQNLLLQFMQNMHEWEVMCNDIAKQSELSFEEQFNKQKELVSKIFLTYCTSRERKYGRPTTISYGNEGSYEYDVNEEKITDIVEEGKNRIAVHTYREVPIRQKKQYIFLYSKGKWLLAYIIHSGFISGYQNRYGDNLKPPTNVYHRMTA